MPDQRPSRTLPTKVKELVASFDALADLAMVDKRPHDAEVFTKKAINVLRSLPASDELLTAYRRLGTILTLKEASFEAEKYFRLATELGSALLAEATADPALPADLPPEELRESPRRSPENRPSSRAPEEFPPIFGEEIDDGTPSILIFVPGIMGTKLSQKTFRNGKKQGGDDFWPPPMASMPNPADGPSLAVNGLSLQGSAVEPTGLFPGAYSGLINGLHTMGYVENINFFIFGYDWRQSNRVSGEQLLALIDRVLKKRLDVKAVNVVCHSMGGLVTRAAFRLGARINKTVYLASPHYGAAKALFTLHPDIPVTTGWKSFIFDQAWDRIFSRSGDSDEMESHLRRVARSFDSTYELLPDEHYLNNLGIHPIYYHGRSGRHDGWLTGVDATYFRNRSGFPIASHAAINNALDFKKSFLGFTCPRPAHSLVIYSDSQDTNDAVDLHRLSGDSFRYDLPRSAWSRGDATVPTKSAKDFLGATNIQRISGTHSWVPNDPATIAAIEGFIGRPGP